MLLCHGLARIYVASQHRDLQVTDFVLRDDADLVLCREGNKLVAGPHGAPCLIREDSVSLARRHMHVVVQRAVDAWPDVDAADEVFGDDEHWRADLRISHVRIRGTRHIDVIRESEGEVAKLGHFDHLAVQQILANVPSEGLPDLLGDD